MGCPKQPQAFILPETYSSHLKMDGWNTSFLLGWPIFRCYVSFREGIFFGGCFHWICWTSLPVWFPDFSPEWEFMIQTLAEFIRMVFPKMLSFPNKPMGFLLLKMISTWGGDWGYHHLRKHPYHKNNYIKNIKIYVLCLCLHTFKKIYVATAINKTFNFWLCLITFRRNYLHT